MTIAPSPTAAPAPIITPGNGQWIGARGEQQDAFGFHGFDDPDFRAHGGVLAVLADGMGGLQQGRAASQLAVTTLRQTYATKAPEESIPNALDRALQAANTAVYQLAMESDGEGQVGTTLVAAVAHAHGIDWVNVGDSRLYGYRAAEDQLTQLSQDHNYAVILQTQVAAGTLEQADADAHPDRAALVSFIGLKQIPYIDTGTKKMPLAPGDRLLLCSDGVHGRLSDEHLHELIRQPAQPAAEAMIATLKAAAYPRQDNATLAILAAEAAAAPEPNSGTKDRPSPPRWSKWHLLALSALLLLALGIGIGLSLRFGQTPEVEPEPESDHL
ncbi:PP2C family protein-serine/threonine phosphatase [Thiorhodovibrio frisius]|uniref:Serine/threonine protein phosphatase n=1 Tax=Thiorhodovibrio frisius TaxID=631362 RepID=H8Z300_9GAMM|nr:protein phosphatase 2C domain-containing protein [Thiorhodovibrio frisius]EIC22772.1 serine/threonine protein phosphatase [Thiorhodovibrio frisius]WPL22531.1 Serine/threonine phosphatase stp [Thiorhodovibrio frisius]